VFECSQTFTVQCQLLCKHDSYHAQEYSLHRHVIEHALDANWHSTRTERNQKGHLTPYGEGSSDVPNPAVP
jgi:hypothetical protein